MKRYMLIFFLLSLSISGLSYASAQAPDFYLRGKEDNVYTLSGFKGKPLILFFFSFTCGHCERAMPIVKGLYSKADGKYNILGIVYGTPKNDLKNKSIEAGIEFPLAVGTKTVSKDYKVSGTPYFWVIDPDGILKDRFVGEEGADILRLAVDAGDFDKRAGIHELISNPKDYEGKNIATGGLLIQTSPSYFPRPVFMITNGADKIRVSSWLPLEVAPAPKGFKKQRKKVMSNFLDKYVIISGKVTSEDGQLFIEVKSGKTAE